MPSSEKADLRWYALDKKRKEIYVSESVTRLRSFKIEPVLIKGLACAMNYPPDVPRYFADIDLAVSAEDFDRIRALRKLNLLCDLTADFHRELRQLDTVPWCDLVDNSVTIKIEGTDVRILRPEDHLRVLCNHWLTDGGAYKERLWDIYFAVQNRTEDFDWCRCLDVVSPSRRNWIITVIAIAYHYLGLDISDLPIRNEIMKIPSWMRRCIDREWRSATRLTDMPSPRLFSLFFRQLLKRIPPNPITATVECEGLFSDHRPIKHQLRVFSRYLRNALTGNTNRKKREMGL